MKLNLNFKSNPHFQFKSSFNFIERFIHKFSLKELLFVFILAVIVALSDYLIFKLFPSKIVIFSLVTLILGINFVVYILKKRGAVTLFYLFLAILTYSVDDFGVIGWKKILTFFIAALLFELFYSFLKITHPFFVFLPREMIVSTVVSVMSIILVSAFLIYPGFLFHFPVRLVNLMILFLLIGLIGSILTYLIWFELSKTKPILKLESFFQDLAK